jgi:hypothetical protein
MSLDTERKVKITLVIEDKGISPITGKGEVGVSWTFDPPITNPDDIPTTPSTVLFVEVMKLMNGAHQAPIPQQNKATGLIQAKLGETKKFNGALRRRKGRAK